MSTYIIVLVVALLSNGQPGLVKHDKVFTTQQQCNMALKPFYTNPVEINTPAGDAQMLMAACVDVGDLINPMRHEEHDGAPCIQLNGPFIRS